MYTRYFDMPSVSFQEQSRSADEAVLEVQLKNDLVSNLSKIVEQFKNSNRAKFVSGGKSYEVDLEQFRAALNDRVSSGER